MSTISSSPAPRHPRFSLLNLLLLTTVAAMGIGLYRAKQRSDELHTRNEALAAENLKHRNELGIFDLTDSKLIHVIRVPTENDQPVTYRLYLPPGRKYRVGYRANRVPEEGLPELADYLDPRGEFHIEPGRYLIRIKLKRQYKTGTREPHSSADVDLDLDPQEGQRFSSSSASIGFSQEKTEWLAGDRSGFSYTSRGIGRELETHDAGEPLVLYRARIQERYVRERDDAGTPIRWGSKKPTGLSDGFMAWIESVEVSE